MPSQPAGLPAWLPGAMTQAAGPGTAAVELDRVTQVLVSDGGARSAAQPVAFALLPAAGAARCHRLDAIAVNGQRGAGRSPQRAFPGIRHQKR